MMRAKMKVECVTCTESGETLKMSPVVKCGYKSDGLDEDNTYARFTPAGSLELLIQNPDLVGKFKPGQKFYLDFTPAE